MKINWKNLSLTVVLITIALFVLLYAFQENLIFFPEKLPQDYAFQFEIPFEEMSFTMHDGANLNGLLFKADSAKGLIFYLHGNAGSLRKWGSVAQPYVSNNFDVFILDYRGYGKSEGSIKSEEQLYADNQEVYNELKKRYNENEIIILGYSIGTGMAAKLASQNQPKMLILQAPYYSLLDLMNRKFPVIPDFILSYNFPTYKYLEDCNMPIIVFHGDGDKVIDYQSSLKLKEMVPEIELITLKGQGHNGMTYNVEYLGKMNNILMKE